MMFLKKMKMVQSFQSRHKSLLNIHLDKKKYTIARNYAYKIEKAKQK